MQKLPLRSKARVPPTKTWRTERRTASQDSTRGTTHWSLSSSATPRLGGETISVEKAASIAGLAEDIKEFPDKYQQLVGERGITLSGGQKQRTAIARAVMRDPRILVLDDSLSAVDTYTEETILKNLRDVRLDRTTLDRFASHLDHPRRRPYLRAARRPHHRTRHA